MLLEMLFPIICLALTGGAAVYVVWAHGEMERTKLKAKTIGQMAEKAVSDAEKRVERAKTPSKTRYVNVRAFSEDDQSYMGYVADVATRPEFRYFLEKARSDLVSAIISSADRDHIDNAVGKLKGLEYIDIRLDELVQFVASAAAPEDEGAYHGQ